MLIFTRQRSSPRAKSFHMVLLFTTIHHLSFFIINTYHNKCNINFNFFCPKILFFPQNPPFPQHKTHVLCFRKFLSFRCAPRKKQVHNVVFSPNKKTCVLIILENACFFIKNGQENVSFFLPTGMARSLMRLNETSILTVSLRKVLRLWPPPYA